MSKSRVVNRNQPCRSCSSSDAMQEYDDGHAFCYSCNTYFKGEGTYFAKDDEEFEVTESLAAVQDYGTRGWRERKLSRDVMDFYGVRAEVDFDGNPVKFFTPNVDDKGRVIGYRVRMVEEKKFYSIGDPTGLLGAHLFPPGGKRIIITEGFEDCASIAQAYWHRYGKTYPVVSVNSAQSVEKVMLEKREYLRSFDEVVIWGDSDEVGRKATDEMARIVGYDKAKRVEITEKDASDYFLSHGSKEVLARVYDAPEVNPAGIVNAADTWELYQESKELEFVPWPASFGALNEKTNGRTLGSITLIAAGTGVGKSSFIREDLVHLIHSTDHKIGICSLEESIAETIQGLMSVQLSKRLNDPNVTRTEEEEKKAHEALFADGRVMMLDHQGSVGDDSLVSKIEFMALSGCKFIYLDHITIAISEVKGKDANQAADAFMSDLLKLVKRHNVWLGVVSHLRKVAGGEDSFEEGAIPSEDDLKGSGSLKQISFLTIALARNKNAEEVEARNKTTLFVLKNRALGDTGPAGGYSYDQNTGRLTKSLSKSAFDLIERKPFYDETAR